MDAKVLRLRDLPKPSNAPLTNQTGKIEELEAFQMDTQDLVKVRMNSLELILIQEACIQFNMYDLIWY